MIDVKGNFKQGKSDILCRKCSVEDEEQSHLHSCQALSDQGIVNSNHLPKYDDLFSQNPLKIEAIGRILMQKYQLLITTMCTDICCAADNTDTQQAVDTVLSDLD